MTDDVVDILDQSIRPSIFHKYGIPIIHFVEVGRTAQETKVSTVFATFVPRTIRFLVDDGVTPGR